MKTHIVCVSHVLLAVSILITSGSSSAFPPHRGKATDAARGAFLPQLPRRAGTHLFESSSSSTSSEFSPDTNAQRKSHQKHQLSRQHPLHSSFSTDQDPDGNDSAANKVARAMDNAWTSVSNGFSAMKTRGGYTQKQRIRLSSELHSKNSRLFSTTMAPYRKKIRAQKALAAKPATAAKENLNKVDYAIFVTYFCAITCLTLSVVTVPAIASDHNLSPHATAAFIASMASLAPLGGFVGKLVNGFVCQHLGGQRSSWVYLLAISSLCLGLSVSTSLSSLGLFLLGFEFLCSIQWTAISSVLDSHYRQNPKLMTRGITLLSISSTVGALAAKTIAAWLLQATDWRTVYRFGSMTALLGATTIFLGGGVQKSKSWGSGDGSALRAATRVSAGGQQKHSPLTALKMVLGSPVFWMIGMGHSLGHLARVSDKILTPFLVEVGGISSSLAVALTSSVTIGFVLGLLRGAAFTKLQSVKGKLGMIKNSYIVSFLSTLGLAMCGTKGVSNLVGGNKKILMGAITLFSGLIANNVSFQFYQIPNMVSSTIFPETSSVALSLTDAVGFLVTAGVMGINTLILSHFGWTACWAFLSVIFAIGGISATLAIPPVLVENTKKQLRGQY